MNSKEIEPANQHSIFEKIRGACSTINSFRPFDDNVADLLLMLDTIVRKIELDFFSKSVQSLAQSVLQQGSKVHIVFLEKDSSDQLKSRALLDLYVECCKACILLQSEYGLTPKIWSDFESKIEASIRGWTLGMAETGSVFESQASRLIEEQMNPRANQ